MADRNQWGQEIVIYFIHPQSGVPAYIAVKGIFNANELDAIETLAATPGDLAKTLGGLDVKIRLSETVWLHPASDNEWIFERLANIVAKLNAEHFRFDINAFEGLQLATYKTNGYFNWHQDVSQKCVSRKLSFTLQLTDPANYVGGDLELFLEGTMARDRGAMVLFPSYQSHRVTPVVSGIRHSLVAWVIGPSFR